ncbi:CPBP family intramembrane glutamic endopeptidase [Microbacter margulisiae]|uniref:Membrane protease YdiL (CAAX protease family) n=1 Tax=Microbacter margulisiae TaxID=1350067 RepID=A0A7W5DRP1_9PORP|nr:CPBP family intramembrane glutamic endopeptidase [Microbacter margulisiae]MBB3187515.1 membrane protease YdiL (CAAX protease family) [Microbacter margulisiae]
MGNSQRLWYGFAITAVIFAVANIIGVHTHLHSHFFINAFAVDTVMIVLSIGVILALKRNLHFALSWPKLRYLPKPLLIGMAVSLVFNILIAIVTRHTGVSKETASLLNGMTPLQVFVFVFIYASIAEELLFRGFLLNLLSPLKGKGVACLKRKLSLPVILSALVFGLAHLILITTGAGAAILIMLVISATCLGLVAGYYQEKHNNHSYAIIVHMAGNLIPFLGILLMSASHA